MGKIHLSFRSYIRKENEIWFSNTAFNGLFRFDMRTGNVKFEYRFKSLPDEVGLHFSLIYEFNDYLIFLPGNSKKIVFYHLLDHHEEVLEFRDIFSENFGTDCSFVNNEILWLFSSLTGNGVWTIDLQTKQLKKNLYLSNIVENFAGGKEKFISTFKYEDSLFIAARGTNRFLEINLKEEYHKSYVISEVPQDIMQIAYDGKKIWILTENFFDIFSFDKEKNEILKYVSISNQKWVRDTLKMPYAKFIFVKGEVYVLSYMLYDIMHINENELTLEKAFTYPCGYEILDKRATAVSLAGWGIHSEAYVDDSIIWIFPESDNMIVKFDIDTGVVTGYELSIDDSNLPAETFIYKNFKEEILMENLEILALRNFLTGLAANSEINNLKCFEKNKKNMYKLICMQ